MNETPAIEESEPKEIPTISEAGELQRLSVSTIQGFRGCERYFYFDKRLKLPKPERKFLTVGTDVHDQNERYLTTGQNVLGPFALEMKPFLPEPRSGPDDRSLLLEHPFNGELKADGVPLSGYIDVVNLRDLARGIVRVTDFKTSKDLDAVYDGKPAVSRPTDLTSTLIGHGIQMVGYAVWAFGQYDVDTVELEHIYTQTKGRRRALNVLTRIDRPTAHREWARVESWVPRMREVAKAPNAAAVPGNLKHCRAYGGCPFQANCLSLAANKGAPMGLMDRLKQARAQGSAPSTPPPAPPSTPPAASAAPVVTFPKDAPPQAAPAPATQPAPVQAASVVTVTLLYPCGVCGTPAETAKPCPNAGSHEGILAAKAAAAIPTGVLPPDAPKSDPLKAAEVPSPEVLASAPPEVQQRAQELATAQKAAEPPQEEKPKRTRKAKTEPTVDKGPEFSQVPPADASEQARQEDAQALEATRAATVQEVYGAPYLRVYVNAIPSGGVFRDLRTYIAEKKAAIEKGFEVEDLRLAPKKDRNGQDHALAFGGWKAVLEKVVKAEPPEPATWVITGDTSEVAQVAIEALTGIVAPENFIRGVR